MEAVAYKLGQLDAVLCYGMTKSSGMAKLIAPAALAATGAALAPDGEGERGAVLGAMGGMALNAGASRLMGGRKPAPAAAPAPVAPAGPPSFQDIGRATLQQGAESLKKYMLAPPSPRTAAPRTVRPASMMITPTKPIAVKAKTAPAAPAAQPSTGPVAGVKKFFARKPAEPFDPNTWATPEAKAEFIQAMKKQSSLNRFKLGMDIGTSVPLVGMNGVGMSFKDQRERLPGMSRWVPRAAMERGFDYVDEGLDPESVMDTEADRGSLTVPALGALLSSAAMHKFAPKSGMTGKLLGGMGGAAAGSIYHYNTRDQRAREGLEAYEGAQRERDKFPIRRHAVQTANEASPLAVSRGTTDA